LTAERDEDNLITGQYVITIKGKNMPGYEDAKRFVAAISQKFVASINESAESVDYTVAAETFKSLSYDMQLKSLADQKAKLLSELDKWISLYHDSYKVNGKTLKNYRTEIEAVYGDNVRKTLEAEWDRCGYVPKADIETRVKQLNAEKAYNDQMIEKLQDTMKQLGLNDTQTQTVAASGGLELLATGDDNTTTSDDSSKWVINIQSASDLVQMLAKFLTRNEQLNYQLAHLQDVEAFDKLLQVQFNELSEQAKTLANVTKQIYKDNSHVLANDQGLSKSGETNVILVAIAAFVLSFLVAAVVVFLIDAPKYKAKKFGTPAEKKEAAAENDPHAEENKPQE
ncbi:MAG: hypothetical protein K2N74_01460, partial [Clostridiales bacterium]|nr:hypothetical protein [Clostridiales bacterium]